MPIVKQAADIRFGQGIDTKTDPKQVQHGKFLSLVNGVFTKGGLLQKRNGYGKLPSLLGNASHITSFNGSLTAIGPTLQALPAGLNSWLDKGNIQPCELETLSLIRNNLNQTQADCAESSNGLICTVYTEANSAAIAYRYAIADSTTGQNVVAPTNIPAVHATLGTPRVFFLGNYFIILYSSITANHLVYIAISASDPTNVTVPTLLSNSYTANAKVAFDGFVYAGFLYIAWNGATASGIKMTYLTPQLVQGAVVNPDPAHTATMISVTADASNGYVWVSYYGASTNGYTFARDVHLNPLVTPKKIITGETVLNLTSSAQNGVNTAFFEIQNAYGYDPGTPTNYIKSNTCNTAGTVGGEAVAVRSVGLASKSFIFDSAIYFLTAYQSDPQPTYFLYKVGVGVTSVLAYQNGGGYLSTGLPSVSISESVASIPYLLKDLIESVNKNTNPPAGSQVNAIYSQTGISWASFNLSGDVLSAEIGSNLNLTGGFVWAYDGFSPVEQNFFLYPDSISLNSDNSSGSMGPGTYFYQVTYEWSDNQGNQFKSAPSIPVKIVLTTDTEVVVSVPTLRLTYKTANPVKIVIYRWSVAQQTYYQVTYITAPVLNDPTVDQAYFTDKLADASILGNNILYTTGGVIENIGPPSFSSIFLFDDRLWGISSEDPNVLWYGKQVIEATPVEMSDLFTMYIAPSLGAQGPSGDLKCGFPMDDKAVLFKSAAIAYFNGTGPDNTGANSQYSPPVLVTSTVGCSNQNSIVFMPNGLMFEFQSGSGNQIWLLGRDLQTQYIGAAVEELTKDATVLSAVNIPGTNQVIFTMSSGITLMYDYYYGQWGTHAGVPAISSTLYGGLHTFINSLGEVYQETPNQYLDGSNPVLISFKTGWFNLAGLQGYIRSYFFYLLGQYFSPHKLNCQIAYDYNPEPSQSELITPTNFAPTYGGPESNDQNTVYGQDTPYGGPGDVENWRVFLDRQRCSAFQITVQEFFDHSFGAQAGQGLSLSGINLVYGAKKGYRPISEKNSAGSE